MWRAMRVSGRWKPLEVIVVAELNVDVAHLRSAAAEPFQHRLHLQLPFQRRAE
jgi:hypothetical protein